MPYRYQVYAYALISLYVIISMINGWLYTFYPLRGDAIDFYKASIYAFENPSNKLGFISPLELSSGWYADQVSNLYIISNSILVGQSVSLVAYTASLPLLYGILKRLSSERSCTAILLLFSLHPMHLLDRVGFLRESWELLLFMSVFWFLLNILDKKNILLNLLIVVFVCFIGMKLHYVFKYILYIIVPFVLTIYSVLNMKTKKRRRRILLFLIVLSLMVSMVLVKPYLSAKYDIIIRESALPTTHTGYISPQSVDSLWLPVILFMHYMASPFPWEIHNLVDLVSFGCSLLRLILLIFSIKNILNEKRYDVKLKKFILLLFCISVAFIYAQGVAAYGTAFRHQLLTYWGLVILGVPTLIDRLKILFTFSSQSQGYVNKKRHVLISKNEK